MSCIAGSCGGALGAPLSEWYESSTGPRTDYLDLLAERQRALPLSRHRRPLLRGTQPEWLLDVSNPAARGTIGPSVYWGWYYRSSPTGFNLVAPRGGKFIGEYLLPRRPCRSSISTSARRTPAGPAVALHRRSPGPASGDRGITPADLIASAQAARRTPVAGRWSVRGGTIAGAANGQHRSRCPGRTRANKPIAATNSACGSAAARPRTVSVIDAPGDRRPLRRASRYPSPSSPAGPGGHLRRQLLLGRADPATPGTSATAPPAVGKIVTHTYAAAGGLRRPAHRQPARAGSGCTAGTCIRRHHALVVVAADRAAAARTAAFQTSAPCANQFGFELCQAAAGASRDLDRQRRSGTSFAWDFGDGSTASGPAVDPRLGQPGSYAVTPDGRATARRDHLDKMFQITRRLRDRRHRPGPPSCCCPGSPRRAGALVQSSDLYVHNPGASPVTVTLEFCKRGPPEPTPPRADPQHRAARHPVRRRCAGDLFGRENLAGFLTVDHPAGTAHAGGDLVQHHLPGARRASARPSPAVTLGGRCRPARTLVGLTDDRERLAYFGVSNPNPAPATYRLRFFTSAGQADRPRHGADAALVRPAAVPGARRSARTSESTAATTAYGRDPRRRPALPVRRPTCAAPPAIPSFVGAGGHRDLPGLARRGAEHPGPQRQPVAHRRGARQPGAAALDGGGALPQCRRIPGAPTAAVPLTLQPGETRRLADVDQLALGPAGAIGVLTFVSREPSGALPIIQGESYDNARPGPPLRPVDDGLRRGRRRGARPGAIPGRPAAGRPATAPPSGCSTHRATTAGSTTWSTARSTARCWAGSTAGAGSGPGATAQPRPASAAGGRRGRRLHGAGPGAFRPAARRRPGGRQRHQRPGLRAGGDEMSCPGGTW